VKKLIRKWLGLEIEIEASRPMVHDVLEGSEMALVAYRIDNGYLLRVSRNTASQMTIGSGVRLIYCTDEKDMAEKIVAHRALRKLAGDDYTAKTNKF
jgi:hypothetical protein